VVVLLDGHGQLAHAVFGEREADGAPVEVIDGRVGDVRRGRGATCSIDPLALRLASRGSSIR
jgi:hypothetical protein